MIENWQQENQEENEFNDMIKSIGKEYAARIREKGFGSAQAHLYEDLAVETETEMKLTILKSDEYKAAYAKALESLLPETKAKIEEYFQKANEISEKLFEISRASLDNEPFDVWEKVGSDIKGSLETLSFSAEEKITFGEKVDKSLETFYIAQDKVRQKVADMYREYLLESSSYFAGKVKELMEGNPVASVIESKTAQDFFKLSDEFTAFCKQNLEKALHMRQDEENQLN